MFKLNFRNISLRLLWYINLFCIFLLMLTYSAPHISPSSSSWVALLALGFPFILLINLFWVGFWLYHKNRAIYGSLFTILVGCFNIPYVYSFGGSITPPSAAIKLMSYNVQYFGSTQSKNQANWLKRQDQIFQYLQTETPDLLFGQEFSGKGKASTQRANTFLKQKLGLMHQHHGGASSLAIYSKFPLENTGIISFEGSFNGVIYADILIAQKKVRVYNFHLQSTRLGADAQELLKRKNITSLNKKETQEKYYRIEKKLSNAFEMRALQAKVLATHIAQSPYPVIVAGDLNDTPLSYAYRILSKKLQDSFVERGFGLGASYAGGLPALRIDYILTHKDFVIYTHHLQKQALSDHYAISSKVLLKP